MSGYGCTMGDWLKPPPVVKDEDSEVMVSTRPTLRFGHCGACGARLAPDRRPQLLPCLHSLCQPCVSQSLGVGYGGCPGCPACGVKYSPENVTHDLFYNESPSDLSKPTVKCGGCGGADPRAWCVECAESLCPTCVTAHQRVKVTRNHTILGRPENPPADSAETARCSSHEREAAMLFCQTCDQLICGICEQTSHRGHRFQLLMKVVAQERIAIKPLMERVKQHRTKVRECLSDMDRRLLDIKELQTKLNNELRAAVLRIRDALLKQAVTISLEIQELCVLEERKIRERQEGLKKLEEQLAYLLSFADRALGVESHAALLSCKQKIMCQIQDLASRDFSPGSSTVTAALCLDDDIYSKIETFGKLAVKMVPFACTDDQNGQGKLEPPHKIQSPTCLAVCSSVLTAQTLPTSSCNVSSLHTPPTSSSILPTSGPIPPACYQILSSFSAIPPSSHQIPPASSQIPPSSSPILPNSSQITPTSSSILPTSSQISPTSSAILPISSQIPPTSSSILPTSSRIPPMYLYIPPISSQIRPNSQLILPTSPPVLPTSPHIPPTYVYMPPTSSRIHPNSQAILTTSSQILSISPQTPPTSCSKAQISHPPLHSGPVVPSTLKTRCPTQPHPVSPPTQMPPLVPLVDRCPAYLPPRQAKYFEPPVVVNPRLPSGPPLLNRLPAPSTVLVPLSALFQPAGPNSQTANVSIKAGSPREPSGPMPNTSIPVSSTPESSYQTANTSVSVGLSPETNGRTANTSTPVGASPETNDPTPNPSILVGSTPETNDRTRKAEVTVTLPPETNNQTPKAGVTVGLPPEANDRIPKAGVTVGLPPEANDGKPKAGVTVGLPPDANDRIPKAGVTVGLPPEANDRIPKAGVVVGLPPEANDGKPKAGVAVGLPLEANDQIPKTGVIVGLPFEPKGRTPNASVPVGSLPEPNGRTPNTSTPVGSPGLAGSTPRMPGKLLDLFGSGSQSASLMGGEDNGDPFGCPVEEDDDDDSGEMWEADTESFPEATKGDGRLPVLEVSLARLPVSFPPPGCPLPRFHLTPGTDKWEVILEPVPTEVQLPRSDPLAPARALPPLKLIRRRKKRCAVCHETGVLSCCAQCKRNFHSDCHLTPICAADSDYWQCMVCEDRSDMRKQKSNVSDIHPEHDLPNQKECKRVFLVLISQKHSAVLYQQPEFLPDSSRYVDVTLIRDRLLQKLSPAYIPSEFASDVLLLLDSLPKRPHDVKSVEKLRRIFQMALSKTFGRTLHPSLLGPFPGKEGEGTEGAPGPLGDEEACETTKRKKKRKRKESSLKKEQGEPLRKKLCIDGEKGGEVERGSKEK